MGRGGRRWTKLAPLPRPRFAPTAGFAQPAGCGSAEQCSANSCLRPRKRGEGSRNPAFMRLPCVRNLQAGYWSYNMTNIPQKENNVSKYNIAEAKARFSELVQKAMLGEEVIIAKGNKPVLKLVQLENPGQPRQPGSGKGQILYMAPDFDTIPQGFEDYT